MERRELFVKNAIEKALNEGRTSHRGIVTASVSEERKAVIHEFYKALLSRPKCHNCGMYSPGFRKDGFTKIFENSLTEKQITNNRVKGLQRPSMIKNPTTNHLLLKSVIYQTLNIKEDPNMFYLLKLETF